MLLVESYLKYRAALRASLRAEYGVALGALGVIETCDLVAWLPPGSALWRATGGPMSIGFSDHTLRMIDYRLQILAWMQTEDATKNRNKPKLPEAVPYANEAHDTEVHAERQAAARRRRAST